MTEEERDQEMLVLVRKHATSGNIKDPNVIVAIGYLTGWIVRLEEENKRLREQVIAENKDSREIENSWHNPNR